MLGLQGDVREHARALEAAGATPVVVKHADELAAIDALVLPGGESTTIGQLLQRFGLIEPLADRVGAGMPLYGTCAGLILMATDIVGSDPPYKLGVLDVTVRRNAYGPQTESFETDLDVAGLDSPVRAVFIRAPVIERVGEGVEVLATYDGVPVLVKSGRLLASSFHPEIAGDDRVHAIFVALAAGSGES